MRSTVCVCVCERPTALTVSSSFITIVCVATRKDGVCTSQELCFSTLCVLFFSLSLFFFTIFLLFILTSCACSRNHPNSPLTLLLILRVDRHA